MTALYPNEFVSLDVSKYSVTIHIGTSTLAPQKPVYFSIMCCPVGIDQCQLHLFQYAGFITVSKRREYIC